MTVQDMDIPYPSQHTLSGNHRFASEVPFKCFRCCIAKEEERNAGKGGGWVGTGLRAPLKPIQCLWCFSSFACVVVVFLRFFFLFFFWGGGGGGKLLI